MNVNDRKLKAEIEILLNGTTLEIPDTRIELRSLWVLKFDFVSVELKHLLEGSSQVRFNIELYMTRQKINILK